MSPETQPRYLQGLAKLREIDGHAGERVVASLADIAPDFARYLIEFPFGDIYSRPGLDLRSREIAVIAALTALGNATPQLSSVRFISRRQVAMPMLMRVPEDSWVSTI